MIDIIQFESFKWVQFDALLDKQVGLGSTVQGWYLQIAYYLMGCSMILLSGSHQWHTAYENQEHWRGRLIMLDSSLHFSLIIKFDIFAFVHAIFSTQFFNQYFQWMLDLMDYISMGLECFYLPVSLFGICCLLLGITS